jgi:hypothetical protein
MARATAERLSRDSKVGQRSGGAFGVDGGDGLANGVFELGLVGEGLVGEVMGFHVTPGSLDLVEFGSILGQPFDGEPMRSGRQRLRRRLAAVDRTIVEHDRDGFSRRARRGPKSRSISSRSLTKSAPRLVLLVTTRSSPVAALRAPIMATLLDWPGAGTRKSAPRLAQARAR